VFISSLMSFGSCCTWRPVRAEQPHASFSCRLGLRWLSGGILWWLLRCSLWLTLSRREGWVLAPSPLVPYVLPSGNEGVALVRGSRML